MFICPKHCCAMFLVVVSLLLFLQARGTPIYACDFENGDMCDMQNGIWLTPELPVYNFTIMTGENASVVDDLAPTTDHTYNSSSGHYIHWHRLSRHAPHTDMDGCISLPVLEPPEHMCLYFAYYIKSEEVRENITQIAVHSKKCSGSRGALWVLNADDTQGWQTAEVPIMDSDCNVTLWIIAWPDISNIMTVALDDFSVDICSRYVTTTTSPSPIGYASSLTTNVELIFVLFVISLVKIHFA